MSSNIASTLPLPSHPGGPTIWPLVFCLSPYRMLLCVFHVFSSLLYIILQCEQPFLWSMFCFIYCFSMLHCVLFSLFYLILLRFENFSLKNNYAIFPFLFLPPSSLMVLPHILPLTPLKFMAYFTIILYVYISIYTYKLWSLFNVACSMYDIYID